MTSARTRPSYSEAHSAWGAGTGMHGASPGATAMLWPDGRCGCSAVAPSTRRHWNGTSLLCAASARSSVDWERWSTSRSADGRMAGAGGRIARVILEEDGDDCRDFKQIALWAESIAACLTAIPKRGRAGPVGAADRAARPFPGADRMTDAEHRQRPRRTTGE